MSNSSGSGSGKTLHRLPLSDHEADIKSSSLDGSTVAVPTLINREPIPLQVSMGLICQTKIGHNIWSMAISGTQIKLEVPTI
jgi:hypothetical protein